MDEAEVVDHFVKMDSALGDEIRKILKEGREIGSDMIVKLLVKRLQLADCKQKGYILEDYPRSRKEAELLSKHGIIPDCTFYVDFAIEDAYGRSAPTDGFDFDRRVLSERIR